MLAYLWLAPVPEEPPQQDGLAPVRWGRFASIYVLGVRMDHRPRLLERAFELARKGATIEHIRKQLNAEHYFDVDAQLRSRTLHRQLRAAGAKLQEKKATASELR